MDVMLGIEDTRKLKANETESIDDYQVEMLGRRSVDFRSLRQTFRQRLRQRSVLLYLR